MNDDIVGFWLSVFVTEMLKLLVLVFPAESPTVRVTVSLVVPYE